MEVVQLGSSDLQRDTLNTVDLQNSAQEVFVGTQTVK